MHKILEHLNTLTTRVLTINLTTSLQPANATGFRRTRRIAVKKLELFTYMAEMDRRFTRHRTGNEIARRLKKLAQRLCVAVFFFLLLKRVLMQSTVDSDVINLKDVHVLGAGVHEKHLLQQTSLCECPPEWGCIRGSLWRSCRGMFPHSAVRESFLRAAVQTESAASSTASIQILPFDFVAGFYLELSYEFHGEQRHLIAPQRANSKLCKWWKLHGDQFSANHERVFVMFWTYVFYDLNVTCIPEHIVILAYENVGHDSQSLGSSYNNGCSDRCIVIPYFTHHSWSGSDHYAGVFDPVEEKDLASKWTYRSPHVMDASVRDYLRLRTNLLAFAGSIDRNPTISRFRDSWRTILSNYTLSSSDLSSRAELVDPSKRFDMYRRSMFCLCIRGDTSTRAAFYEAILEGCSPVVYTSDLAVYTELFDGRFRETVTAAVLSVPDGFREQDVTTGSREIIRILEAARSESATRIRMRAISMLSKEILYDDVGKAARSSTNFSPAVRNSILAVMSRSRRSTRPLSV